MAVNAGAGGYDLGDVDHFKIYGLSAWKGQIFNTDTSFQSLYIDRDGGVSYLRPAEIYTAIQYSRVAVFPTGAINSDLDSSKPSSWGIMGLRDGKLVLLKFTGLEGVWGYTQLQVAQEAQERGLVPAFITDSGRPDKWAENDLLKFDAFHTEKVQFAVGFPAKPTNGGTSMYKAKERLGKTMTIRNAPKVEGKEVGSIGPKQEFDYAAIVADLDHPSDPAYQWLDLGNGTYTNYFYPDAGQRATLLTQPSTGGSGPLKMSVQLIEDDGTVHRPTGIDSDNNVVFD